MRHFYFNHFCLLLCICDILELVWAHHSLNMTFSGLGVHIIPTCDNDVCDDIIPNCDNDVCDDIIPNCNNDVCDGILPNSDNDLKQWSNLKECDSYRHL
ncbi:hypothetical protein CDAR_168701 [Caerostris darwini]|uniref:Uncharacterized protein n=1 Tax=Caerostris darwini TaxID=1538125 RepID=A0AAV4T8G8_9ARAC|nr:hypothetical protein CDAR_168701 [Caerostris darwini]